MQSKGIFLCLLIAFISCVIAEEDLDTYRLPSHYLIDHYDIDLTIPAESFTADSSDYEGSVEIKFQVTINTNEVKLHASSNIQLTNITILENGVDLLIANSTVNSTTDILTIQTERELITSTNYTLRINFEAELLKSEGFYKASYIDAKNITQYIAATQFEATHARKAFPCFDEPAYKATFAFRLTYPSNMNALTNTAQLRNETDQFTNLTTTTFDTSPRMSVYLVAFVISKYTCDEGNLDENVKHYVCSREDQKEARQFAMVVTPKVIDHLDSYTGIRYADTLFKLDQVAVSEKGGAMENWGLVLYGESALLFDKTLQTNEDKQNIAGIISHELAHQWFGNLVTCKWWSELFLNEGFATMFEFYTTANVFPEYEMEEQFVIRVLQPMLVEDGSLGIPSLVSNASTQIEISAKFGGVSYSKGGSVLRMIEHVIGRNNFQSGVQKYLKDNKYGSAESQDLWDALESTMQNFITTFPGETSLSEVVENWISKPGYPLLTVTLNNGTIEISQKRFLLSGNEEEKSTWHVPVSYTTSENNDNNENTSPKGWVTPTKNYELTDFTNSSAWIVVNNQQTGYYRVNYDDTLWNNLATALKQTNFSGIHVSNRAQIVEDSFNLAKAGLLSFQRVLKNVEFLVNEDSYLPWYSAVNVFWYLLGKTGTSTKLGAAIAKQFLELAEVVTESVPLAEVDDEKHVQTLKQVLIYTYVCQLGNDKCKSDAKELFSKFKTAGSKPDINIRSIVYCNAMRYSENPKDDWDFLWKQYQTASESGEKSAIWSALGCATDTAVLNSFLSKFLEDDENISSDQYALIFYSIYSANEIGVDKSLDYFIDNFEAIYKKMTSLDLTVRSILTGLGSAFTKKSQIEKLEKFITTIKDSAVLAYANAALTIAKDNQEVIEKYKDDLYEYYGLPEDDDDDNNNDNSTTTSKPDKNKGGAVILEKYSLVGLILVSLLNMVYFKL